MAREAAGACPVRELAAQIVAKTAQVRPKRMRQTSRGDKVA
jgi:hypothetical protein